MSDVAAPPPWRRLNLKIGEYSFLRAHQEAEKEGLFLTERERLFLRRVTYITVAVAMRQTAALSPLDPILAEIRADTALIMEGRPE